MKGKIIEAAGKTWKVLGEKEEVKISDLGKLVKEKGDIVFQALGWLAREDKVCYVSKNRQTFVSLVEPELAFYRSSFPKKTRSQARKTAKSRIKKALKLKK